MQWIPLGAPWEANHPSSSRKKIPLIVSYFSSKALARRKNGTRYTNGQDSSLVNSYKYANQ